MNLGMDLPLAPPAIRAQHPRYKEQECVVQCVLQCAVCVAVCAAVCAAVCVAVFAEECVAMNLLDIMRLPPRCWW